MTGDNFPAEAAEFAYRWLRGTGLESAKDLSQVKVVTTYEGAVPMVESTEDLVIMPVLTNAVYVRRGLAEGVLTDIAAYVYFQHWSDVRVDSLIARMVKPDTEWVGNLLCSFWNPSVREIKTVDRYLMFSVDKQGRLVNWETCLAKDGTLMTEADQMPPLIAQVALDIIHLLGVRNVELYEPGRKRAVRRRIERTGMVVHEIAVKPVGRSAKGGNDQRVPLDAYRFHGVRGHYATYGSDGRGLLFGKLSGRFFVPPHVRGNRSVGEVEQRYVIEGED